MTNRELPEDPQSIADAIRGMSNRPDHSGNVPVEQGGEHPVEKFDNTPLDEAVGTHIDPNEPPEDASTVALPPYEQAAIDQSTAVIRDNRTESTDQPNHRRRNIALGTVGLLLVAGIGGGWLLGRGHDKPDATGPNQTPGTHAPQKPGQPNKPSENNQGKPSKNEQVTNSPLDARANTQMTPKTDNQFSLEVNDLPYRNPTNLALTADIPPSVMNATNNSGAFEQLLQQDPNNDLLYGIHERYTPEGILEVLRNQNLLNAIYNQQAELAQLYGNPQSFRGPDTAKLIGPMPVVPTSMFQEAARTGDYRELWAKAFPDVDVEKAFVGELQAGNTGEGMVSLFTKLTMQNSMNQGDMAPGVGTRASYYSSDHDYFAGMRQAYLKDKGKLMKQFAEDESQAKLHTISVTPLVSARGLVGVSTLAPEDAPNKPPLTLTTTLYDWKYLLGGTTYDDYRLVAWVAAPTIEHQQQLDNPTPANLQHQFVTGMVLDEARQQVQ